MKVVLQRVKKASVNVEERVIGSIDVGYLLLVGFEVGDGVFLLEAMLEKINQMKLFPDAMGRFSHSLNEISGSMLVVSQFTLSAELKKGRKPSFTRSLDPKPAEALYDEFIEQARKKNIPVQTGEFGAMMQVSLQNDGPVTIILDSKHLFPLLHEKHKGE